MHQLRSSAKFAFATAGLIAALPRADVITDRNIKADDLVVAVRVSPLVTGIVVILLNGIAAILGKMNAALRVCATILSLGLLGLGFAASAVTVTPSQGLNDNALVAGKTTGFRLITDAATFTATNRVDTDILRPDGSRLKNTWSRAQLAPIEMSTRGSSFVVTVPGRDIPWVGGYSFRATVLDNQGKVLATHALDDVTLLPTKDVRFIVTYLYKGGNPDAFAPTSAWDADVQQSMLRLGSMLPIRDGVQSSLNGDRNAGLRYQVGTACDGYVAGYYDCVYKQTRGINAAVGDHIDVSIEFRPGFYQPCREVMTNGVCQSGGNSARPGEPYADLRRASCVSGNYFGTEMTAACFAQEIGHNFGLEPAGSPHFQDPADPGHSKDAFINNPDAFDFVRGQLFGTLGDVMNNSGGGASQGRNAVMYNAFDWGYLRKQFMNLTSTGPTLPAHFSTDVAPSVAGVGGSVYFFARRVDGRIFYNRAIVGQAGAGWIEMEGGGRTNSPPAVGAIGSHVFAAIRGLDGSIYLNQTDDGKPFGQWFSLNFKTDVTPAVTAVGQSVFIFAKGLDQRIYLNQAELGHGFSGWFEVQGGGRTDVAPAAGAIGKHV